MVSRVDDPPTAPRPIAPADGSALPFAQLLMEAGLVDQKVPRRFMRIPEPVSLQQGNIEILGMLQKLVTSLKRGGG